VSRTLEEFYTVRCQVTDMRNIYESLDEVTVKDTLEGDNMYTCSQCGKKVRAEKRLVLIIMLMSDGDVSDGYGFVTTRLGYFPNHTYQMSLLYPSL